MTCVGHEKGHFAVALLVFAVVIAAAAQETPSQCHRMTRRVKIEGIHNAGEVTPNLFRGGAPTTSGLSALKQKGVAIIVDLRGVNQFERKKANALGMEYVPLPWHCPFPRDATFARFLKLLRDNRGKKVFVHCRLGDDRVGMAIAAYRMAEEGWSADEAMKEMEAYGFTWSHHFICVGLASYEAQFPQHWKNSPAFADLRARSRQTAADR